MEPSKPGKVWYGEEDRDEGAPKYQASQPRKESGFLWVREETSEASEARRNSPRIALLRAHSCRPCEDSIVHGGFNQVGGGGDGGGKR